MRPEAEQPDVRSDVDDHVVLAEAHAEARVLVLLEDLPVEEERLVRRSGGDRDALGQLDPLEASTTGAWARLAAMYATSRTPSASSGTAITEASWTIGWPRRTLSTSIDL